MEVRLIGFIPPVVGVDGEFNTFRLGWTLAKKLSVGEKVFLSDEKGKFVFGTAEVLEIQTGLLGELCASHAHMNHTELTATDGASAERLFKLMQKIYGPHIAQLQKRATVVYLRRLE